MLDFEIRMFKLLGCGVFREQRCQLNVIYDVCYAINKFLPLTNTPSQRYSTCNLQIHGHSINFETIHQEHKQEISRL